MTSAYLLLCSCFLLVVRSISAPADVQGPGEGAFPQGTSAFGLTHSEEDESGPKSEAEAIVQTIDLFNYQASSFQNESVDEDAGTELPHDLKDPSGPVKILDEELPPQPNSSEELIDGLPAGERAYRLAILRTQLIEKLGLADLQLPKGASGFRDLPRAVKKWLYSNSPPQRDFVPFEETPDSRITEVLSYAENDTDHCPQPGFCLRFNLVDEILGKPVKSVHLWMRLTSRNQTTNQSALRRISVFLLQSSDSGILKKELATKIVTRKDGWFHFELPEEKNDWTSPKHRLQLTNAATTHRDSSIESGLERADPPPVSLAPGETPILIVAVDGDRSRRVRRQSENQCPLNVVNCCLQLFNVDLNIPELLGGIVEEPQSVRANFCRGGCAQVPNVATLHAGLLRNRAQSESDANLRRDLMPCCVPAAYNPGITVAIRRPNNTNIVERKHVTNISAQSCVCT